jgi:hypothetical protein
MSSEYPASNSRDSKNFQSTIFIITNEMKKMKWEKK